MLFVNNSPYARGGFVPMRLSIAALLSALVSGNVAAGSDKLSLEQAVQIATSNDLTLAGQRDDLRIANLSAIEAGELPPPMLGIKLANLPVDSFQFNQEPMTQAMVSYTQKLPAKGLLSSRKSAMLKAADIANAKSQLRKSQLRKLISSAWVKGWQAEQVIGIIKRHRSHFEQMIRSAEANYRAGLRRASQREVIALNTSLAQLDNRSQAARTRSIRAREAMREWLDDVQLSQLDFASQSITNPTGNWSDKVNFNRHPASFLSQRMADRATADIDTAAAVGGADRIWSVSYGYREDSNTGMNRGDFVSLGFSMQLPSLRNNANRARIEAAQSRKSKIERDGQLVELQLRSEYQSNVEINSALEQQLLTYTQRLIPQLAQQAESTRGAYTSGEAPFMSMQRTQMDLMNIELEQVDLEANILLNTVNLDYLTAETVTSSSAEQ